MNYRPLGRTGVKVSELCLGTMTFGKAFFNIGVVEQKGADELVRRSLDAGVNFFDTANVYSRGQSEEILGQALRNMKVSRDQVIVATKVAGPMTDAALAGTGDFHMKGLSRRHILAQCDASLKRLGMDHIDLYQCHSWDAETPLEETLSTLNDLVRAGKVRYIGCSNWSARGLMKALMMQEAKGWAKFVSLQPYYSLAGRDIEHEVLPLCREEGIAVLPWSPLSGGALSGKYTRATPKPEGARRVAFDFPPVDDRIYDAVDALQEVAKARKTTAAQVALAWALAQEGITSVIIGANKLSQLEDNLASADLKLSPEDLAKLSATTQPKTEYPQWMIEFQRRRASMNVKLPAGNGKAAAKR
jgi:aryl-alcohol dehydrogenase-like predicted oxidoreductase